jgi:cation diffusion facilitator family transporter
VANPTSPPTTINLQTGARLAFVGVVVNVLLAAVKILTGWFGNSYALIADGVESSLDIASSIVIWGGLRLAAKPPDASHPYGHGKAEPVATIIVAVSCIAAAAGLAIESIGEIITPRRAPALYTLLVLIFVIFAKETLFRRIIRLGQKAGSTAIQMDAWHHRSDAITSAAAFIGISTALIGGKGYESADAWAALFACALIAFNGLRLLRPAAYELMDTAPPKEIEESVRLAAHRVNGVVNVEQCRIRKMGLEYFVDLHIGVDGDISVREGHRIAHEVKDAVRRSRPAIADVLVHIEPASRAETVRR